MTAADTCASCNIGFKKSTNDCVKWTAGDFSDDSNKCMVKDATGCTECYKDHFKAPNLGVGKKVCMTADAIADCDEIDDTSGACAKCAAGKYWKAAEWKCVARVNSLGATG